MSSIDSKGKYHPLRQVMAASHPAHSSTGGKAGGRLEAAGFQQVSGSMHRSRSPPTEARGCEVRGCEVRGGCEVPCCEARHMRSEPSRAVAGALRRARPADSPTHTVHQGWLGPCPPHHGWEGTARSVVAAAPLLAFGLRAGALGEWRGASVVGRAPRVSRPKLIVEAACACGCGAGTVQQVSGSMHRLRVTGGGNGGAVGSLIAAYMSAGARTTAARTAATPNARSVEEAARCGSLSVKSSAGASWPPDIVALGSSAGEGGGWAEMTVAGLAPSSPTPSFVPLVFERRKEVDI